MVVALLIAGCSTPSTAQSAARSPEELVARLAVAERNGDAGAVRELVDADSPAGFLDDEIARVESLRSIPLSSWRYRIDSVPTDSGSVRAVLEYSLRGGDLAPARRPLVMTVVRRDRDWYVSGSVPVEGVRTYRGPWDYGPVIAAVTASTIVVAHRGDEALRDTVAGLLPSAIDDVARAVGGDWQRNVVVWLTVTDSEYATLADTQGSAAASVVDGISDGQATGQRVVLSPGAKTRLDRGDLDVVLRHELVHVATRARTKVDTAIWVTEGFADFVAYRGTGAISPQNGEIPVDSDFSGPLANRAYAAARTVFDFVDDRCGVHSALRFYDLLADGTDLSDAAQAICGLDEVDFRQTWREWTLRRAGGRVPATIAPER